MAPVSSITVSSSFSGFCQGVRETTMDEDSLCMDLNSLGPIKNSLIKVAETMY